MKVVHLLNNTKGSVFDLVSILCSAKVSGSLLLCVRKHSFLNIIKEIISADLIHIHEPVLIIFTPFIKNILRKKVVITLHDEGERYMKLTMFSLKKSIFSRLFKFSIKFPDYIICVSEHIRSLYSSSKIPVSVIYNPIITSELPRASYTVPSKNLIFVGNQVISKGFVEVVKNIDYLNNYFLHFFGVRGEQISILGDRLNLIVHPFVERKSLFEKINDLKGLIVITSLSEGFGMFAAECARLGYPMVLNYLPVYDEFLTIDRKNLFDIKDFQSLLNALESGDFKSGVKIKSSFDESILRYIEGNNKIYRKIYV